MNSTPTIPAIRRSITVNASLEHCFRTFTEGFNSWWPASHHIGPAEMAEAVLEPKAGGRWYERGVDGSECDWGTVVKWDPPHGLVLTWQIDGQWQFDPDPTHASEIEVRFIADGPTRTMVDIEHRNFDQLPHATELADAVGDEAGWNGLLARFAEAAQA